MLGNLIVTPDDEHIPRTSLIALAPMRFGIRA